jgi:hypothetical protein
VPVAWLPFQQPGQRRLTVAPMVGTHARASIEAVILQAYRSVAVASCPPCNVSVPPHGHWPTDHFLWVLQQLACEEPHLCKAQKRKPHKLALSGIGKGVLPPGVCLDASYIQSLVCWVLCSPGDLGKGVQTQRSAVRPNSSRRLNTGGSRERVLFQLDAHTFTGTMACPARRWF